MEKIIKIQGMSCNHCTASVQKALDETKGVESAEVSLEGKCARVIFDENEVTLEELNAVVEDQGFDVV